MKRITTESGAAYEYDDTPGAERIRRLADDGDTKKRRDGDWLALFEPPIHLAPGRRMILVLEPLTAYGPDDHGTPQGEGGGFSTRITTPVVNIEELGS